MGDERHTEEEDVMSSLHVDLGDSRPPYTMYRFDSRAKKRTSSTCRQIFSQHLAWQRIQQDYVQNLTQTNLQSGH